MTSNLRPHVVYALNEGHVELAGIAAHSMLRHQQQASTDVAFLCVEVSDDSKTWLRQKLEPYGGSVDFRDITLEPFQGLSSGKWSPMVYTKLLIPDLFPDRERSLYCDNDTICCGDVSDLFTLDLGDAVLAGIPDLGNFRDGPRWFKRKHCGLSPEQQYVNGGVLLLNNNRFRNEHLFEALLSWMLTHQELLLANEQDGINIFLKDRIHLLPFRWNYQHNLYVCRFINPVVHRLYRENKSKKCMVHFTGPKPWEDKTMTPERVLYARECTLLGVPAPSCSAGYWVRMWKTDLKRRIHSWLSKTRMKRFLSS